MSTIPTDVKTTLMSLIVYAKTVDEIEMFLSSYSNRILHFAYICHDKDLDEFGTLKEAHYHLCLKMKSSVYISNVLDNIKDITKQNAMGQCLSSKYRMTRYMLHADNPEKYQYSVDELVTDDIGYWINKDQRAVECVYDMVAGADIRYLLETYGREFIMNMHKYQAVAAALSCLDDDKSFMKKTWFNNENDIFVNKDKGF